MKTDFGNFFNSVAKTPNQFLIIHYSSQSLYDEGTEGLSPRITSIVIMHFATRQTTSFSVHSVADMMGIAKDQVEACYNTIEKDMLGLFFAFMRDRLDSNWVHWNMRNLTFGFEHLEHRSLCLGNSAPPVLNVEHRLNLNDIFQERFGQEYVKNPKMKSLMMLNGDIPQGFLNGAQEAAAFKAKDFIRMHASTICKVEFFRHAILLAQKGKLKTASRGWGVRIDRLLESRGAKIAALSAVVIGVGAGLYQTTLWIFGK